MDSNLNWGAVVATVAVLVAYELAALVMRRLRPHRFAQSAHAGLREQWFDAVSSQKGTEILAVQTLRNSLMSATMLASTSALALMGTVTLSAPSLRDGVETVTPRLVLELVLIALLFTSLVSTVMAVRFYNHASFIGGFPVDTDGRKRWAAAGRTYVRRAGVLYSVGLRHLVLVVPVVAGMIAPWAGPVAALLVTGVLLSVDRVAGAAHV
jgi:hypothetical protein